MCHAYVFAYVCVMRTCWHTPSPRRQGHTYVLGALTSDALNVIRISWTLSLLTLSGKAIRICVWSVWSVGILLWLVISVCALTPPSRWQGHTSTYDTSTYVCPHMY